MNKYPKNKGGFIRMIITILITFFIIAFVLDYFGVDFRTLIEDSKLKEAIVAIWDFLSYLWIEYIWWFIKYIIDIFIEIFSKIKPGAN